MANARIASAKNIADSSGLRLTETPDILPSFTKEQNKNLRDYSDNEMRDRWEFENVAKFLESG